MTPPGRALAAVVLLCAAGCGGPDASDARTWYDAHRPTIEKIAADVSAGIATMPELGSGAFVCPPAKTPETSTAAPVLEAAAEAARCAHEKSLWLSTLNTKRRSFGERFLLPLLKLPGVIGVKVEFKRPIDAAWQGLAALGLTPGGVMGARVEAKDGIGHDDRSLGWGQYQTSYSNACGSFGDGEGRNGFETAWGFEAGDTAIHVEAFVLAEDTVDDAWRAGLICVPK